MAKRLKLGEVLEIRSGKSFAYLQYLGKHPEYGDGVRVSPKLHPSRQTVDASIFSDGYVTFYPAQAAVSQGLASPVGHLATAPLPTRYRRPGMYSGTKILSWVIEDEAGEEMKKNLSADDRLLPIASIWNHEYLLERLAEQWRPEREGTK